MIFDGCVVYFEVCDEDVCEFNYFIIKFCVYFFNKLK